MSQGRMSKGTLSQGNNTRRLLGFPGTPLQAQAHYLGVNNETKCRAAGFSSNFKASIGLENTQAITVLTKPGQEIICRNNRKSHWWSVRAWQPVAQSPDALPGKAS